MAAWITAAFKVFVAMKAPSSLQRIHHPKLFIKCYGVNYVLAKLLGLLIVIWNFWLHLAHPNERPGLP